MKLRDKISNFFKKDEAVNNFKVAAMHAQVKLSDRRLDVLEHELALAEETKKRAEKGIEGIFSPETIASWEKQRIELDEKEKIARQNPTFFENDKLRLDIISISKTDVQKITDGELVTCTRCVNEFNFFNKETGAEMLLYNESDMGLESSIIFGEPQGGFEHNKWFCCVNGKKEDVTDNKKICETIDSIISEYVDPQTLKMIKISYGINRVMGGAEIKEIVQQRQKEAQTDKGDMLRQYAYEKSQSQGK